VLSADLCSYCKLYYNAPEISVGGYSVYNRMIITFSEVFLNVDWFKAGIFQNIFLYKDVHAFVYGKLFFGFIMLQLLAQDLISLVLFILDATKSQLPHQYSTI